MEKRGYEEIRDIIEEYIDKESVSDALMLIQEICFLKAEHIATNWQDEQLALDWEKTGNIIGQSIPKLEKIGL